MMKSDNKNKIITYITDHSQATATVLVDYLGVSKQLVHRLLNTLQEEGLITKTGRPPKVFYLLAQDQQAIDTSVVASAIKAIIDDNFLNITPTGEKQEGFSGFIGWCQKRKLPVAKTAGEYVATFKKYQRYKKSGLIDGMHKLKGTFPAVSLDKVFYLDFYSIERFGKTKLGQLLLYAKQSQDKKLIKELTGQIQSQIEALAVKYKIDAVGFIPPTVKREVQMMREIERQLQLPYPRVALVKVKTPVSVPQKTLNKLEDRIENAKSTIMVDSGQKFGTVLLIDDALGSGATINETAKKIKLQKVARKVIGLAITGSFSGFEVISEV